VGEGDGFRKETLVALAAVERALDLARGRDDLSR
jgi:hypothetical protein